MDAIKELGIEKNTLIIWTSDNGDEDSYYKRTKTFDGNGPFRGVKRSLYEGGIRAPMLAYWPGTINPNTTSDLQTTQWDLMPTVADAGGQPITEDMDGISIMPTLSGNPDKQTQREYIYFEFYERAKQQSVRMGNWKAYRQGGWEGDLELYDLGTDIGETTNIANKHPGIAQRMREIMRKEHSPHPVWNLNPTSKIER
jgi:arylsulfatase A-like enzyme